MSLYDEYWRDGVRELEERIAFLERENERLAEKLRLADAVVAEDASEIAPLSFDDFARTLAEVCDQMAHGKGEERHGRGRRLEDQPWRKIAEGLNHGRAFLEGQAIKKIMEASWFDDTAKYDREMAGAQVYTTFARMFRKHQAARDSLGGALQTPAGDGSRAAAPVPVGAA